MEPRASMIEVKRYVFNEGPEFKRTQMNTIEEWKEFWQGLTYEEQDEYKVQVAKELGR